MKEKKRYNVKKLSPEQVTRIEDKVAELAEIIVSANYFLVGVEMVLENGRWYLRIYLDHPNPQVRVSLEDCRDISEALGPMIEEDVPDLGDLSYNLEVSSPGLFRELREPREFQFYRDRRIEIKRAGEQPFIAYSSGFDRASGELLYRLGPEESPEPLRLSLAESGVSVSLSPDLTEKIELKPVPRRIERYD